MGEPGVKYRSMPGNVFSPVKLWMGPDHLMLTKQSLVGEECRRFYFPDIQAIIVRRTHSSTNWRITLTLLTGTALILCLAAWPTSIFMWFVAIALLGLLVRNLVMGPSCECHLKTGANLQRISSISRMKDAMKLLDIIRPAIRRAQEEVIEEDLRRQLDEAAAQPPGGDRGRVIHPRRGYSAGVGVRPAPLRPYDSKVHPTLFAVLLVGCIFNSVGVMFPTSLLAWVCLLLMLSQLGLTIAAIVKQRRTDLPNGMRITVGFSMGYICVFYFLATQGNVMWSINSAVQGQDSVTFPWGEGYVGWVALYGAICSGTLGLIGAFRFAVFSRSRSRRRDTAGGAPATGPIRREREEPR